MNQETYYKNKCKTNEFELKKYKSKIPALKKALVNKEKELATQADKLQNREEKIEELNQQLTITKDHIAALNKTKASNELEELRRKLKEAEFESKKFRCALATAFKASDDLESKVNMRQLLELSAQQLLKQTPSMKSEDKGALRMPGQFPEIKTELDSCDETGETSSAKRISLMIPPRNPLLDNDSDDSESEPLMKRATTGSGGSRRNAAWEGRPALLTPTKRGRRQTDD